MADDDLLELGQTWDVVVEDQCECPSAPQQFLIPPPPPPPSKWVCGGNSDYCHLEPMGAEFTQSTFPSLPIIAVCSSVVLVAVLVASFLLWRHKTKVQNLLPCKHEQQGRCDLAAANGVTYEDVLINHHPTRLPQSHLAANQTIMPIELLDVKLGDIGPPQVSPLHRGPYFACRDSGQVLPGKRIKPVYEEVPAEKADSRAYDSDIEESAKVGHSLSSEDDFAEDELSAPEYPSGEGSRHCSATSSVQGSTGGDLCKDPVSSDEGAGDDCDFMSDSLPGMPTDDSVFNYAGKGLDLHCPEQGLMRLNSANLRPNQPGLRYHDTRSAPGSSRNPKPCPPQLPGGALYPQPLSHSNLPIDKQRILPPPSQVPLPCSTFMTPAMGMSPPHTQSAQGLKGYPKGSQWGGSPAPLENNKGTRPPLPVPPPEMENIYSTIDEPEDGDTLPTTTSRSQQPHLSGSSPKHNQVVPKRLAAQDDDRPKSSSPLSQQSADDENGSYGDIMPDFNNETLT